MGFMGSGKTIFGKRLAAYSNFDFLDLDVYFEEKHQINMLVFLLSHAEAAFREIDRNCCGKRSKGISLLFLWGEELLFSKQHGLGARKGLCVLFAIVSKALLNRLLNSMKNVPFFSAKTPDELLTYVASTLAKGKSIPSRHIIIPASV